MLNLPTVILMTSNGVGMGHLSRQLTVALSGNQQFRPVIFSLSKALPRVMKAESDGDLSEAAGRDLRYEYCPSRESLWLPQSGWRRLIREKYRSYRWHPYLRDRLVALVRETGARAVMFDGVFPYAGLLAARQALPETPFLWVRRGMWKADVSAKQLKPAKLFDEVVEPGDFGSLQGVDLTTTAGVTRTPPISLTDVLGQFDSDHARRALGLDPDRPTLLLAPGSGALGSVESTATEVRRIVSQLDPRWQIAVTKQDIARHTVGGEGIHVLKNVYPLVRYLKAFDAAVSAAGYNSVHELLGAGIPTLFIPSVNHATDDQRRRAEGVAAQGAALVSSVDLTGTTAELSPAGEQALSRGNLHRDLESAVSALFESTTRASLTRACANLERPQGGQSVADLLAERIGRWSPDSTSTRESSRLRDPDSSRDTEPRPTYPQPPLVDARTRVQLIEKHQEDKGYPRLIMTESPSPESVLGPNPVEHILRDASPSYVAQRQAAVSWLYRIV